MLTEQAEVAGGIMCWAQVICAKGDWTPSNDRNSQTGNFKL